MLTIDSNNITALHYLLLLGDTVSTEMDYASRLIVLQPLKSAWWRIMGGLWAKKGKSDSAFGCFEHAYHLAPADVRAVIAWSDVLIDKHSFAAADTILDSCMVTDSMNSSLLKLRIRSAYMAQDYSTVFIPGERLVRTGDPSVVALTQLALAYYNSKMYSDCIRVCDHMIGLGLQLESIYYYEARAYTKLKDYARSNELLTFALSKAISNTAEWYLDARSDNFEALKNYPQALANIDTAYYLFRDPVTLYNCGRLAESRLHNPALARTYYRRYLAFAQPKTAEERRAYAYVKARWGRKK
jgi:tetratricopeptide (TPR) repeat protein